MRCKVMESNSQISGSSSTTNTAGFGMARIVALAAVTGDAARCYDQGPVAIRSHQVRTTMQALQTIGTWIIPLPSRCIWRHLTCAALIESLRAQARHSQRNSARDLHALGGARRPSQNAHALPLHINPRRIDIAADWNFALAAAETQFVTLAHQDDYFRARAMSCG